MSGGKSNFGPRPWHQENWDFRAALNFMFGGTGAGLLLLTAFSDVAAERARIELLLALAFIGAGLISVWFELGRPLRAPHVGYNPHTSWMTRESYAAGVVFPLGLLAVWFGNSGLALGAALAVIVFVYCQGRMLRAAKGIPAWREPAIVWLVVTTGLSEGAGVYFVLGTLFDRPGNGALAYFLLALIARGLAWSMYRGGVAKSAVRPALAVLDRAGKILVQFGTIGPLALLLLALLVEDSARIAVFLAGVGALVAGWQFKFALITRAAYNQGFSLPHLPVRGSR